MPMKNKKKESEKWPNIIPLLAAEDLCTGQWQEYGGQVKCCLVAWANIAFGPKNMTNDDVEEFYPNFPEARLRARNLFLADVVDEGNGPTIRVDSFYNPTNDPLEYEIERAVSWNDAHGSKKLARVAEAWNKAMIKNGYDVTNPVTIK